MNRTRRNRLTALWSVFTVAALLTVAPTGWGQSAPPSDAPVMDVRRFVVEGDNPLSAAETDAILAPHLGQHRSLATLEAAANALEQAIRDRGFAFHRVIVPAQRPAAGELTLRVLSFPLNQVTVTGNEHFSAENILRSLPALETGKTPDVKALAGQLGLANEHPSKRLSISIRESQKVDALDAEVRVRDTPASQTFIGLTAHTRDFDNTINQNTGYSRLTVGHQQSNLFDLDHALTLAYTTSPEYMSRVKQYGVFYWLPFYGYNTALSAYWTKSDVDTGTVGVAGQSFDVSGRGEFWGLRLVHALPRFGEITHNVSLALDDRFFESSVGSGGTAITVTPVGSRPISLRYTARHEGLRRSIAGYAEYVVNTGGGRANSDVQYQNALQRIGTDPSPNWSAFRWGLDASYALPANWLLIGRYRAQYADEPLIAGEQIGLGGVGSVRGLRDRETAGDKGFIVNIEAQAPELAAGLTPFMFYDYGSRTHVTPLDTGISNPVPTRDSAASIGLGVKWNWQRRLELSATYAHVVNGLAAGTPSGHDKLLFSAFYRF